MKIIYAFVLGVIAALYGAYAYSNGTLIAYLSTSAILMTIIVAERHYRIYRARIRIKKHNAEFDKLYGILRAGTTMEVVKSLPEKPVLGQMAMLSDPTSAGGKILIYMADGWKEIVSKTSWDANEIVKIIQDVSMHDAYSVSLGIPPGVLEQYRNRILLAFGRLPNGEQL